MKKLNKKGFTLIELLAVIVILGVLMLVAIPAVSRYIENSKKKTFISNAATLLDAAVNQAQLDNISGTCYMPIGSDTTNSIRSIETEKKLPTDYSGYVLITAATASTPTTYTIYLSNTNYSITNKDNNGVANENIANVLDGTRTAHSNSASGTASCYPNS